MSTPEDTALEPVELDSQALEALEDVDPLDLSDGCLLRSGP